VTPDGYPHTLASGLDDYPRGQIVSDKAKHLDLQTWMIWAASILGGFTEKGSPKPRNLKNAMMNWPTLCDYDGEEYVCDDGYVTLFPLLLGVLDPKVASEAELILDLIAQMGEEESLFAPCGLRSLSRGSDFYLKGDAYWTGPCWQPFNYLALAALDLYSRSPHPQVAPAAKRLYDKLRDTVISNALSEWESSGMLHEQYSPEDGSGQKGPYFTGWSSLVVLILAEEYEGILPSEPGVGT